ncbi:hypothetical protein MIR68_003861 [Amoeboaphelidium protococcarum]|nr:hypothetical protein MIR68_003861 [Amoeboaphelidium protococcarum]
MKLSQRRFFISRRLRAIQVLLSATAVWCLVLFYRTAVTKSGIEQSTQESDTRNASVLLLFNVSIVSHSTSCSNCSLIIKDGIITSISQPSDGDIDLSLVEDEEQIRVNCHGMILTPGFIDMHSHAGVDTWPTFYSTQDFNEQNEQLIGDVRDAIHVEDSQLDLILKGGVTSSLILPGSANIIGGYAQIVKHRPWAQSVQDLLLHSGQSHISDQRDKCHFYRRLDQGSSKKKNPRLVKMAVGENVRSHQHSTRIGIGLYLRQKFTNAQNLIHRQNKWCSIRYLNNLLNVQYPDDVALSVYRQILLGDAVVHTHVYSAVDIEMLLQLSMKFNFIIAALHHATSVHEMIPFIKKNKHHFRNLSVAMFSDRGYYKYEAYRASVNQFDQLIDAGLNVAIKSDHPIVNAQLLHYEAFKTHHYSEKSWRVVLDSVTKNPAIALGIQDRVGDIKVGMDADLVLWPLNPILNLQTRPALIVVDGHIVHNKVESFEEYVNHSTKSSNQIDHSKVYREDTEFICDGLFDKCSGKCLMRLYNLSLIYIEQDQFISGENLTIVLGFKVHDSVLSRAQLNVNNFQVVCSGQQRDCSQYDTKLSIDMKSGIFASSPVAANTELGVNEISQELVTQQFSPRLGVWDSLVMDGGFAFDQVINVNAPLMQESAQRRNDTVLKKLNFDLRPLEHVDSKLMIMAQQAGIQQAVVIPPSSSFSMVRGVSSLIALSALNVYSRVIQPSVALHLTMGRSLNGDLLQSFSGQLYYFERLLQRALRDFKSCSEKIQGCKSHKNKFVAVLAGDLTLAIHVDNAELIRGAIRIKSVIEHGVKQLCDTCRINMVIYGGAESWMVADLIAKNNIQLILTTPSSTPEAYDRRRSRSLSSLYAAVQSQTKDTSNMQSMTDIQYLIRHGVKFALATDQDLQLREMFWWAGLVQLASKINLDGSMNSQFSKSLSDKSALDLISWNVLDILGINSTQSHESKLSYVAFIGGNPLKTSNARILLSIFAAQSSSSKGQYLIQCAPKQI